jgi:hypothetical protein
MCWTGIWVGLKTDPDDMKRRNALDLPGLELHSFDYNIPSLMLVLRLFHVFSWKENGNLFDASQTCKRA